jgi:hypothetical protein
MPSSSRAVTTKNRCGLRSGRAIHPQRNPAGGLLVRLLERLRHHADGPVDTIEAHLPTDDVAAASVRQR